MCGPSALATALQRTHVDVTPAQLAEQVYVPGRQGSLQLELIGATRRHDRLAVQIPPESRAIVDELIAGRPILIMQNLGVAWLPFWHYAVVVGYDSDTDSFVLRSGTTERLIVRRTRFERTWARADKWAIVILEPGELPQSHDSAAYTEAVAGLESVGSTESALQAYRTGLARWPTDDLLLLGYGNALYASGSIELAAQAYRNLLSVDPDNLPGLNNLAHTLNELGCRERALALIAEAPEVVEGPFAGTLAETRRTIVASPLSACRSN